MNPAASRILVVEDDARIRLELEDALTGAGFTVMTAATLSEAQQALQHDFDLMVLDLGMPDGDGLDFCRNLRRGQRALPVLILTARSDPMERVRGLDLGADDYLGKPFFMPEVVSRIRSILRRAGRSAELGRVEIQGVWADPRSHRAGVDQSEIELKPREFDLLLFFLRNPGRAWTREQLLDRVWGMGYWGGPRTVDLHVRRLRLKIEENPEAPTRLQTVYGVGYRYGEGA